MGELVSEALVFDFVVSGVRDNSCRCFLLLLQSGILPLGGLSVWREREERERERERKDEGGGREGVRGGGERMRCMYVYCMAPIFCRSLISRISQISKCSRNLFS